MDFEDQKIAANSSQPGFYTDLEDISKMYPEIQFIDSEEEED